VTPPPESRRSYLAKLESNVHVVIESSGDDWFASSAAVLERVQALLWNYCSKKLFGRSKIECFYIM
jgi:hypothetical protein